MTQRHKVTRKWPIVGDTGQWLSAHKDAGTARPSPPRRWTTVRRAKRSQTSLRDHVREVLYYRRCIRDIKRVLFER